MHTLSEILFANLDVSTQALSWLVIFLAGDKSIQRELREEIQRNLGAVDDLSNRRDSLLRYCFLETLRLRPFTGNIPIPTVFVKSPSSGRMERMTMPP